MHNNTSVDPAVGKVLVVEDSQTQAEKLRLILEMNGFEPRVASTGDEALALLRSHSFDMVISDVVMPGISGYELCRSIRNAEGIDTLPFLLLTSRKDPVDIINGLECGADAFLTKPYVTEQLVARVNSLLSNKGVREESRFSMGADLQLFGRRVTINTSKEQIFNLLISTFEDIHATNLELQQSQQSLAEAKQQLEQYNQVIQDRLAVSRQDLYVRNQAIESLNSGIVIIDVSTEEFIVKDVNAAFCKLTGYGYESVIGKPFNLFPGEQTDKEKLRNIFDTLSGNETTVETIRSYRQDGSSFWNNISLRPITTSNGPTHHYVAVLTDVTRRENFQLAMHAVSTELHSLEGDSYYRQAVRYLADILDTDIAFISRIDDQMPLDRISTVAFCEQGQLADNLNNFSVEGTPCANVIDGHACLIERDAQQLYPMSTLFREKGIQAYAAEPIKDQSGRLIGYIAIMQNRPLSDRVTVAQLLQLFALAIGAAMTRERNRRQYQNLFEFAPDAMLMSDSKGIIRLVNRQAEQLFGWSRAELQGQDITMLIPEHAPVREHFMHGSPAKSLGNGQYKLNGLRRDGTHFPAEISHSPMETGDGLMIATAIRDITERQRQEEDRTARAAAERANQAKSTFLATMSHEIRTPMNGVIGSVDLLARSHLQPHQTELVETIRDSAFSLLTVIDDVLDLSKIEAGKLTLEREQVSLQSVVETTTRALKPLALHKGVTLSLFADPRLPQLIVSDSIRLRQILNNLISNAIKFSSGQDRQGRISVRAEPDGDSRVRLVVSDNGIGMDPKIKDALFTPFVQAERSTTRKFGGTGLGLAICRHLVELFGGQISVDSTPGAGATFTVILPVTVAPQSESNPPDTVLTGHHCLVVADPQQAQDWCQYLEYAGAVAEPCDKAELVASKLSELPISNTILVIEGNSETWQQWRTSLPLTPLPALVVIGHGQRQHPRQLASGVVSVDGDAMTRAALLRAVATAAGIHMPQQKKLDDSQEQRSKIYLPPDRNTAVAQGRLILVAEDNVVNQKVIRRQLALLGLAADIVDNGRQALNAWRRENYALLITDLHMPELDGYELTCTIRSEETDGHHLPIIALTANALKDEAERCKQAGMNDYLSKPTTLDRLESMLETWLPDLSPTGGNESAAVTTGQADHAMLATLDTECLTRLIGNDPLLINEFLGDFRRSAAQDAIQLRESFDAGDIKAAGAIAHRLKASSHAVGALSLWDCCKRIERLGTSGRHHSLGTLPEEFESALSAVFCAIDRKIQ